MNKYLEKVASLEKTALNALKAFNMAKSVGLIPDATSVWKPALRALRDSRGAPLVGKALADKRVQLGDISNNAFQQISARSRKQGLGTELGGAVSKSGNLVKPSVHAGPKGSYSVMSKPGDNFHTHPIGGDIESRQMVPDAMRFNNRGSHGIATPSGTHLVGPKLTLPEKAKVRSSRDSLVAAQNNPSKVSYARNQMSIDRNRRDNLSIAAWDALPEKATRMKNIAGRLSDRINSNFDLTSPVPPLPRMNPSLSHVTGDLRSYNHLNIGETQRVVAPSRGVVSVTKMPHAQSLARPRTTYFSHTPIDSL